MFKTLSFKESFNVLDCGIYRVISRRGSQSDEETSSLMNQSMCEEEQLKEFSFVPEEDQPDHGKLLNDRGVSKVVAIYLVCRHFFFNFLLNQRSVGSFF